MLNALRALGTIIEELSPGELHITPPERFHGAPDGINCGLAGTVMRFVGRRGGVGGAARRVLGGPGGRSRPM